MTSPGGSSNNRSSRFSKSKRTRVFLRNFCAAAASTKPPSMTSGERSENELSGFYRRGQTLDLLWNFGAAFASPEQSLATGMGRRKREPSPSLELTLVPPGFKKSKQKYYKSQQPSLCNLPPYLPQVFRCIIESWDGQEVQLVTQKVLTYSDLSSHMARLLLPENQLTSGTDFLRTEEKARLELKMEIAVGVISSDLVEKALKFKLWLMGKKEKVEGGPKPKATRVYSLQGGWVGFANDNKLKEKDKVQLWSFRVNNETHRDSLKFVIVKLEGNDDEEDEGGDRLSLALRL